MSIHAVYPMNVDRASYEQALEQCVTAGNWLFNRSSQDVWFSIDDFEIKIPAGKRILCTGWDQVRRAVEEMDTEELYGCRPPVGRCGFKFVGGDKLYIYDRLVVFSPDTATHWSRIYGLPERTLEEHIALINTMGLDRITVVAEDLSFLLRCPGLRSVHIVHAKGIDAPLDFSPLYELTHLQDLSIDEGSNGITKSPAQRIDFARLPGLKQLGVCTNDPHNYHVLPKLEQLRHSNSKRHRDLTELSCSPVLKSLDLLCCSTRSLKGIEKFPLQALSVSYLRSLEDISDLAGCASTLRMLSIDACGKIRDFSCLQELVNLECLFLGGSNSLPDLSFINGMPNLKVLNFSMTIEDGDLTPCLRIPYATFGKGKRHYNLKDRDLPKSNDYPGFKLI